MQGVEPWLCAVSVGVVDPQSWELGTCVTSLVSFY